MNRSARRRGFKSWLVEPYKQVKLGLMFLLVNGVFAVLILAVFGYYVMDMYTAVTAYFKLSQAESAAAMEKFSWPIIVGVGVIIAFVITTLAVSVRYTHEIYGPLVSIHRHLDDILAGNGGKPLKLRASDQLKDLARKLNGVSERIGQVSQETEQVKGPLVAVHRHLDDLLEGKNPPPLALRDDDELKDLADKINKLAAKAYG